MSTRTRGRGAAAPAAAPAAPPPPPSEGALYTLDSDAMTIDGRRFRIGEMRIGASLRFTDWGVRFIARGAAVAPVLQALSDPTTRAEAVNALNILTLLPEDEVAELVAIALSNDEQVDRAWVAEHWSLGWVLAVLDRFTAVNPLGDYLQRAKKVMANLTSQMQAPLTNGATRTR